MVVARMMPVGADEVEIDIVVLRRPGVDRVVVRGDVDQLGAQRLDRALAEVVAEHPDRVDVDLSGATFFCSAGVIALTHARTSSNDRVRLVAAAPVVNKVLRLTGMTATLTSGETESAAAGNSSSSSAAVGPEASVLAG